MPGEARSHRDGRNKCLRMAQAALGVLEVGSGWVFQAVFYCPVSCATSDEMCGISPEHPPTAWPQTASSSCLWDVPPIPKIPAPLWSFPKLGEEESGPHASPAAFPQSHTLSQAREQCCAIQMEQREWSPPPHRCHLLSLISGFRECPD